MLGNLLESYNLGIALVYSNAYNYFKQIEDDDVLHPADLNTLLDKHGWTARMKAKKRSRDDREAKFDKLLTCWSPKIVIPIISFGRLDKNT